MSEVKSWFSMLTDYFRVDPRIFPPKDQKMTAVYSREKEYLFDVNEGEEFFTPAVRARIVDFILRRKRYTDNDMDDFAFGVERLLASSTYAAAYPLHDVRDGEKQFFPCTTFSREFQFHFTFRVI